MGSQLIVIAMYVLPRALESAWSSARRKAWVPIVPFGETILGAVAMGMVMDAYKVGTSCASLFVQDEMGCGSREIAFAAELVGHRQEVALPVGWASLTLDWGCFKAINYVAFRHLETGASVCCTNSVPEGECTLGRTGQSKTCVAELMPFDMRNSTCGR
jgi:hypothetical protein